MARRYRELWVGLAGVAVALAVLTAVGAGGWSGAPSGCIAAGDCYCEALRSGLVAQPAATASALGFVLVGLLVLASIGRDRGRSGSGGPMRATAAYPAALAAATLLVGIGSMASHAAITEWGGWLDLVGIYGLVLFFLVYDLARLRGWHQRRFLGTYGFALAAAAAIQWPLDNGLGRYPLGVLILLLILAEVALAGRLGGLSARPPVARRRSWLVAGAGLYLAGNALWLLSHSGGPLCAPDSAFQGHAAWHLAAAGAVGCFYLYLRDDPPPAGS